ncbi:MAG: hypothetical protein IRY92_05685, partial [Dactylosporangium sp.]|nr:hypothetical protein [Dactylosporangium sp.]
AGDGRGRPAGKARESGAATFAGAFAEALQRELVLSAHAGERLRQAGLSWGEPEASALGAAVAKAAAKGSRQCLAVSGQAAYVVHVPTRTVITVVTGDRMREGIFTGIDSTVFTGTGGLDRNAGTPAPRNDGSGARAAEAVLNERIAQAAVRDL